MKQQSGHQSVNSDAVRGTLENPVNLENEHEGKRRLRSNIKRIPSWDW